MKIQKRPKTRGNHRLIQALLRSIGLPWNRVYTRRYGKGRRILFWEKPESELLSILEDAKRMYKQSIKRLHPDKSGNHEDASELNMAWARIKLLFSRRGLTLP